MLDEQGKELHQLVSPALRFLGGGGGAAAAAVGRDNHQNEELLYKRILKLLNDDTKNDSNVAIINQTNSDNKTAFHIACCNVALGERILKLLYNADPDLILKHKSGKEGSTPLHDACRFGHSIAVQFILRHYSDAAKQTDNYGRYPIHVMNQYYYTTAGAGNHNGLCSHHLSVKALRHLIQCSPPKVLLNVPSFDSGCDERLISSNSESAVIPRPFEKHLSQLFQMKLDERSSRHNDEKGRGATTITGISQNNVVLYDKAITIHQSTTQQCQPTITIWNEFTKCLLHETCQSFMVGNTTTNEHKISSPTKLSDLQALMILSHWFHPLDFDILLYTMLRDEEHSSDEKEKNSSKVILLLDETDSNGNTLLHLLTMYQQGNDNNNSNHHDETNNVTNVVIKRSTSSYDSRKVDDDGDGFPQRWLSIYTYGKEEQCLNNKRQISEIQMTWIDVLLKTFGNSREMKQKLWLTPNNDGILPLHNMIKHRAEAWRRSKTKNDNQSNDIINHYHFMMEQDFTMALYSAPESVILPDPTTNLYPFMVVAVDRSETTNQQELLDDSSGSTASSTSTTTTHPPPSMSSSCLTTTFRLLRLFVSQQELTMFL